MKLKRQELIGIHRKLEWILEYHPDAACLVGTIETWYKVTCHDAGDPPADKTRGPRLVRMPAAG